MNRPSSVDDSPPSPCNLSWNPADSGLKATGQIYLDNNATTTIAPTALEMMSRAWQAGLANPSSQHRSGQMTARLLAQARESLLQLLGADLQRFPADELVFTSGGTEANNLALFGLRQQAGGNIVISGLEHPSVSRAAEQLGREGVEIRVVDADYSGTVDAQSVLAQVDSDTRLVSLMLVNHETGVIQPVDEVARECRQRGVLVHTDAVQAIGKLPVSLSQLQVDALSFAAHKFHGPTGIGGLVLRSGVSLQPQSWGGFHEQGRRAGTESVALAVGAATALNWYRNQTGDQASGDLVQQVAEQRDRFESILVNDQSDLVVIGAQAKRVSTTSCIAFPGVDRQALVLAADTQGIACSTGSACASGSSESSPTLRSMRLDPSLISAAVRFSWGLFNELPETEEAARRILKIYRNLRR